MQRRQFLEVSAGALAAAALGGCLSRTRRGGSAEPLTSVAAFTAARRYADLSAGKIAYVERGSGDAALSLHGFPLNSYQWRGAIDRLSAYRRCIAPDFMGLGFTEVASGQSVTPASQVAMLVALLDSLKAPVVDVIANDSGGAVAQLLMTQHPARVRTVLLTNCDTEPDSPPPALKPVLDMARAGTFADSWFVPWVANKTLARSADGLGGQTFTNPSNLSDEAVDYYLGPLVSSPRRKALLHAYALGLDPNPLAGIEPLLKQSRIPTRVVWGTGDPIFSQASPAYLDRTLGASRGVRLVPGAKLFYPEEYPDLIAEEARRLWENR
jgi:pimeloyl-ACP methyl ester carboxylesterase